MKTSIALVTLLITAFSQYGFSCDVTQAESFARKKIERTFSSGERYYMGNIVGGLSRENEVATFVAVSRGVNTPSNELIVETITVLKDANNKCRTEWIENVAFVTERIKD